VRFSASQVLRSFEVEQLANKQEARKGCTYMLILLFTLLVRLDLNIAADEAAYQAS
jgi:hypothetical protein